MPRLVVLLSGPVSSGKTTLANKLVDQFGFRLVKTWELLKARSPETQLERTALQQIGEELDQRTGGAWVADDLATFARRFEDDACLIVDAVRMGGQIDAVRRAFGPRVAHIHLCAPIEVLDKRYRRRKRGDIRELASYSDVRSNKTEFGVPSLETIADAVIDSARCTEDDVLVRAASALKLYGRGCDRLVDVLIGGGYGSEGKGQVAAYLSRGYDILVRVGGPNAGHKVYEEPESYTFHSLPSGTRSCAADLILGPGAVLYVPTLLKEIADCEVPADRLSIDPQATIIGDDDRIAERAIVESIASTGQGVGHATARRILRRGLPEQVQLARDIPDLRPFIRDTCRVIERACCEGKRILVEGTQGTGLSLYHGSYPHVTVQFWDLKALAFRRPLPV